VPVDTGRHSTDAICDARGRLVQDAGQTEAAHAHNVAVAVEEDAEAVTMLHVIDWLDPDVALRDGLADYEVVWEQATAPLDGDEQEAAAAVDDLPVLAAPGATRQEVQGEVAGVDGGRGRDEHHATAGLPWQ